MGVGMLVLRRPAQAVLIMGIATLVGLTLNPIVFVNAGPEEVVLVDIVELRRFYRSVLGEPSSADGLEFYTEDGSADLGASVDYLGTQGVSALEVYGSFLLARLEESKKDYLESLGLRIEPIPQRTLIPAGDYTFDRARGEPSIPPALTASPPTGGSSGDFIVQFLGPPKSSWVDQISELGGQVKASLGRFTALVRMTGVEAVGVGSLPFVEWIGLHHPAYKIMSGLTEISGDLEVVVTVFSEFDLSTAARFIDQKDGDVIEIGRDAILGRLNSTHLTALARQPYVAWIDVPPLARQANTDTTGILQSGQIGSRPIFAKGIRGEDELVTLADSGLNTDHLAFFDPDDPVGPGHRKVEAVALFGQGAEGDETGHGTHTAGTFAGDDGIHGSYSSYDGHAFAARIYMQDISRWSNGTMSPPGDIRDLFQGALDNNSWIHSNSWASYPFGDTTRGNYSGTAQWIDDFISDHPTFIVIVAAGNAGDDGGTLSNLAHAKNAIVVGASDGQDDLWSGSSRGWTKDGRNGITVVAPGICIMSARNSTNNPPSEGCTATTAYREVTGTSMATPAVAGLATLIRQHLLEGWYPTGAKTTGHEVIPASALVKALLVNSAVQLTGSSAFKNYEYFPNADQGWGQPLLDDVLYFAADARRTGWRYVDPGISVGETLIFKVSVTSNSGPMNVALTWTDPEGTVGCWPDCLVNDLDLTMRSPGGYWYHGNQYQCPYDFPPGPPYESCEKQYTWQLTPDRENNTETFYAITPPTGTWEARVTSTLSSASVQPFALVVTGHGLTQTIEGVVRDDVTNDPIADADVTLTGLYHSYTTTTDYNGYYTVAAAPDTYSVAADRCNYFGDSRSGVTSDPGFLRKEDFLLSKRIFGTVFGNVKDNMGQDVFLATVKEACTGTFDLTDANGDYSLPNFPSNVLISVTASKTGYIPDSVQTSVIPFGQKEENFVLGVMCSWCPT